jgi:RNA polymerase sigma factor (sigma-70 family)
MAHQGPPLRRRKRGRYVVAMVLGTALSALGAQASPASEPALRAVNDISRYCTTCWRNARLDPNSWHDCTQEVFCRLLERVAPDAWSNLLKEDGEGRREFMRAIDAVKKRSQRARRWTSQDVEILADRHDSRERRLADDRQAVNHAAAQVLTPRQQRILQLSLEGWSVQDISSEVALPSDRVSDEKYKAVRKLRQRLEETEESAA